MKHVVMFSGGAASWATAKRVAERHGTGNLTLLFADTNTEDADLYRFLHQAAANVFGVGSKPRRADARNHRQHVNRLRAWRQRAKRLRTGLVIIGNGGRDIWDTFRESRFLGTSRVDPCSRMLKREPCGRWMAENCDPDHTRVYVGISHDERHRFDRLAARRAEQGWTYEAPLCDPPYLTRTEIFDWLRSEGIEPPRLYALGFAHNNCGGGCVKAGHAHWEHLLKTLPDVFAEWERKEEEFRQWIGRDDIAILRDRSGGESKPLTLREFRERVEAGSWGVLDLFANEGPADGCGGSCFFEPEEEAA